MSDMIATLKTVITLVDSEDFEETADDLRAILTHLERTQPTDTQADLTGAATTMTDRELIDALHELSAMQDRAFAAEMEVTKLRGQVRELRARLRFVARSKSGTVIVMSKSDRRTMRRALHPDTEIDPARKRLLDAASRIFNRLAIVEC